MQILSAVLHFFFCIHPKIPPFLYHKQREITILFSLPDGLPMTAADHILPDIPAAFFADVPLFFCAVHAVSYVLCPVVWPE